MRTYLELFRAPGVLRITAAQLLARLPLGMLSLAVVLHVRGSGGTYGLAGLAVACVSLGEAGAAPLTSRIVGTRGPGPTLLAAASVNAGAMVALALLPATTLVLAPTCFLVGASVPPLMPVVRAVYPQLVAPSALPALFSLDTTAQELIWVVGPTVATFLSGWSTAVPLVAGGLITAAGTVAFVSSPRLAQARVARSSSRFGRVLAERSVVVALVTSFALVASYAALEIAVVARFSGHASASGLCLGAAALGSFAGGVSLGHRRIGLPGLTALLAVVAGGTVVAAAVPGVWLVAVTLFLSGCGFAPALATLYLMVSRTVAEEAATEAFGWLHTGALVGAAFGTAMSGAAEDAFAGRGAFTIAALAAAVAMLVPLAGRAAGGSSDLPRADADRSTSCR